MRVKKTLRHNEHRRKKGKEGGKEKKSAECKTGRRSRKRKRRST